MRIPTSKGLGSDEEGKDALESWKPLSNSVLRYIWTKGYIGHDVTGYDNSKRKTKKTQEERSQLTEKSWRRMIHETNTVDPFWEDELEMWLEREPLDGLRTELERRPSELGANASAGQLLALAFAGAERLDWVRFGTMSLEALCTGLRQPEMQSTKTMALGVELASGNDCAAVLDLLGELPNLLHICCLESPKRLADENSMDLLRMLATGRRFKRLREKVAFTSSAAGSRVLRGGGCMLGNGGGDVNLGKTCPVLKFERE
ncbi:hypothetical protein NLG97_g10852 [Lecanicillium saksenae]|uniref:Uncharacterized protein n=1 Tax=Lecanicillium saksenae TaxID=468837 RepID=A0ACC1QC00_9HYPO|nr:hypothetical protein NLG97_g10852 [Lecanicillium saksenae]